MDALKKLSPEALAVYTASIAGAAGADAAVTALVGPGATAAAQALAFHEKAALLRVRIKELSGTDATIQNLTKATALTSLRAVGGASAAFDMSDDGNFLFVKLRDHVGNEKRVPVNRGKLTKRQKRINKEKVAYYRSVYACDTNTPVNENALTAGAAWESVDELTASLSMWKVQMMYFFSGEARRLREQRMAMVKASRKSRSNINQRAKVIATQGRKVSRAVAPYMATELALAQLIQNGVTRAVGAKAAKKAHLR